MAFIRYNENPFKNDTIDCAIRAISTFLDMDWDDIYVDLCVEGFISKEKKEIKKFIKRLESYT